MLSYQGSGNQLQARKRHMIVMLHIAQCTALGRYSLSQAIGSYVMLSEKESNLQSRVMVFAANLKIGLSFALQNVMAGHFLRPSTNSFQGIPSSVVAMPHRHIQVPEKHSFTRINHILVGTLFAKRCSLLSNPPFKPLAPGAHTTAQSLSIFTPYQRSAPSEDGPVSHSSSN